MPIEAKDWYEISPDFSSFYQGDVVRDVPVIFLPDKISQWFLLRPDPRSKKYIDDVLAGEICAWFEAFPEGSNLTDKWQHGEREEFVAAKAKMMNAIIVTQSCDLVNRSYYQVAPIYPESRQKKLEPLRENQIKYTFFLPALSPWITENSYADLSHITFVPKRYFPRNTVREKLAGRLTSLAITKLQEQVAEYFGRPFGFSEKDTVRATAEYACIGCFYSRALRTVARFESGTKFTKCGICGHDRWLRILESQQPPPETGTEPAIRRVPTE
jgi:hypothetical protein